MYDDKIQVDKATIIYENTPATLLGNLCGCLLVVAVLWSDEYLVPCVLWLSAMCIFALIRYLHYRSFSLATASYQKIISFSKVQAVMIFVTGSIWGSAGLIFFDPEELQNVAFIILALVCMIAGSLASLSSRPITFSAFVIPVTAPLIVNMFIQEQRFYLWMGFGLTAYVLASFTFSLNLARVIHNSLKLKYENLDLIVDLKEQTEKANIANKEKSRFLAATSHDLRQPLHAVNLFYEVLKQKITEPEQLEELENIHRGLNSLNSLLDILFDISRLDAEVVEENKTTFNLGLTLQNLSRQFELDAQQKGIEFNFEREDHLVYSDPALLERVLINLLVNAVRYTRSGSVHVFITECSDGNIAIHVKDTGIGIPQERLEDIFSEFLQLHNPERDRQKGLGLGLAIVKRVLNLLNHKIEVHSTVGQGSEFILFIPKSDQPLVELPVEPSSSPHTLSLTGLNVMLIENEVDIINAMEALITQWDCQFIAATSTEDALDYIFAGEKPDIILSDYRMPGTMNGCQVISKIQSILGDIPAIIITGDTGQSVAQEIADNNLVALHKPIKPAQLRILMSRLIQSSI